MGRADDAGVVAELSDHDLGLGSTFAGVGFGPYFFEKGLHEVVTFVAYAAADGENVGLEDVDDVTDTASELAYREFIESYYDDIVVDEAIIKKYSVKDVTPAYYF